MIDHPFLSFKDMSEEELLEKQAELHRNLSRAHMWGSSQDLINQLSWMLEMIEEEKMERMAKVQFEAMQAMFPERVESDPEFKTEKSELEEVKSTVVKPAKVAKTQDLPAPIFHKEYTKAAEKKQK